MQYDRVPLNYVTSWNCFLKFIQSPAFNGSSHSLLVFSIHNAPELRELNKGYKKHKNNYSYTYLSNNCFQSLVHFDRLWVTCCLGLETSIFIYSLSWKHNFFYKLSWNRTYDFIIPKWIKPLTSNTNWTNIINAVNFHRDRSKKIYVKELGETETLYHTSK